MGVTPRHRDPGLARRRARIVVTAAIALASCGDPPAPPLDRSHLPETPAAQRFAEEIYPILRDRCVDCHHPEVEPPWYAHIPVLGGFVSRDVEWGRERFDLSRPYPFNADSEAGPRGYLLALRTALTDDAMPPWLYGIAHPGSHLSGSQRRVILEWIDQALQEWPTPAEDAPLAERAEDVFRNRCARCHQEGVDDEMNGGFDYVTDLAFLADDEDYVVAGESDDSPLYERLTDDEDPMPPSPSDRLAPHEIEWIRQWIDAGAPTP